MQQGGGLQTLRAFLDTPIVLASTRSVGALPTVTVDASAVSAAAATATAYLGSELTSVTLAHILGGLLGALLLFICVLPVPRDGAPGRRGPAGAPGSRIATVTEKPLHRGRPGDLAILVDGGGTATHLYVYPKVGEEEIEGGEGTSVAWKWNEVLLPTGGGGGGGDPPPPRVFVSTDAQEPDGAVPEDIWFAFHGGQIEVYRYRDVDGWTRLASRSAAAAMPPAARQVVDAAGGRIVGRATAPVQPMPGGGGTMALVRVVGARVGDHARVNIERGAPGILRSAIVEGADRLRVEFADGGSSPLPLTAGAGGGLVQLTYEVLPLNECTNALPVSTEEEKETEDLP